MGLLDSLFSPQATAPKPAASVPSAQPTAEDFIKSYIAAQKAGAAANPGSFWNLITGRNQTAATAQAQVDAPAAWQKLQQMQQQTQSGQITNENAGLGETQNYGMASGMAGVPIDPKNPTAAIPALSQFYGSGAAPQGQSGPQAAPSDPLQERRAFYDRLGNTFLKNPATAGYAEGIFKLRDQGIPEGTTVLNGNVVDGVNGKKVGGDVGSVVAGRAGKVAFAQGAGQQAGLNSQTGVPVVTDKGPGVVTQSEVMRAGKNGGETDGDGNYKWVLADSPQYKSIQANQQEDLKSLKQASVGAQTTQETASQLYNAANELQTGTGTFGDIQQHLRKLAIGLVQLAGGTVDPKLADNAAAFEKMNFAGLNFVQSSAHGFSPRAALQIVKMIQNVKPGDKTTAQGIKQIITQEVMPPTLRDQALYGQANDYYRKNPLKTDATAVLPSKNPTSGFTVKPSDKAQPGDWFIHPKTGELLQRPGQ